MKMVSNEKVGGTYLIIKKIKIVLFSAPHKNLLLFLAPHKNPSLLPETNEQNFTIVIDLSSIYNVPSKSELWFKIYLVAI